MLKPLFFFHETTCLKLFLVFFVFCFFTLSFVLQLAHWVAHTSTLLKLVVLASC